MGVKVNLQAEGLNRIVENFSRLGGKAEGLMKVALYPAVGEMLESIKAKTPKANGDLRDSLICEDFKADGDFIYSKIQFVGYDRRGVPNQLKANAIESGTSHGHDKKPFFRPAAEEAKPRVINIIDREFRRIIAEEMEK